MFILRIHQIGVTEATYEPLKYLRRFNAAESRQGLGMASGMPKASAIPGKELLESVD